MVDVTPELKKRIGSLWSLANIATLIGLLGTITGLIGAFAAVAKAAAADRSTMLSAKISEAMNNTWFGLAIAVTCMIGHVFLNAASKKQQHELEAFAMKLENLLAESTQHAGAGSRLRTPARDACRDSAPSCAKMREHAEEMAEEGGELNLVPYPRHRHQRHHVPPGDDHVRRGAGRHQRLVADHGVAGAAAATAAARAEAGPQPDGVDLRQGLHHRRLGRRALLRLLHRRRRQPAAARRRDAADHSEEGQRVRLRRARRKKMAQIKESPTAKSETKVIVNANPEIVYDVIVQVLDACRGKTMPVPDPDHPGKMMEGYERFGDVLLSAGVELMATQKPQRRTTSPIAKRSGSSSASRRRSRKRPSSISRRTSTSRR